MAARMYRIGDYVYCDESACGSQANQSSNNAAASEPYQIRRIEELVKTAYGGGSVEARVACFYRRRDLSSTLLNMLDRQPQGQSDEDDNESSYSEQGGGSSNEQITGFQADFPDLTPEQQHYLKHREVFLTRQIECIPATCIRGKCQVNFFHGTAETYASYLSKDNVFFYRYLYEPGQRLLTVDRGEVKIGPRYQAEVPEGTCPAELDQSCREQLVWSPFLRQPPLTDKEVDQVMLLARSVGTFARALDCSGNSIRSMDWSRSSGLHMSAAAASRDITLFHAMKCLHDADYDVAKAVLNLVPSSGPVLCRDELEDWSASEAFLFEEALEQYGKDFQLIRKDVLPWKSTRAIVEYYYMWKTTDRYVQKRRAKGDSGTCRLKQVFIPPYSKPSPYQFQPDPKRPATCDSCFTQQASRYYRCCPNALLLSVPGAQLHHPQINLSGTLCDQCFNYWSQYGGLKWQNSADSQLATAGVTSQRTLLQRCPDCDKELRGRHQYVKHCSLAHGHFKRRTVSPPGDRIRDSFCLITTRKTKVARLLCSQLKSLRKMWRHFAAVDLSAVEHEYAQKTAEEIRSANERLDAAAAASSRTRAGKPFPQPKELDGPDVLFPAPSPEDVEAYFARLEEEASPVRSVKRPKLLPRSCTQQRGGGGGLNGSEQPGGTRLSMSRGRSMIPGYQGSSARGGPRNNPLDTLQASCVEGTDGVFVITSASVRNLRRQVPIGLLRRAARFPWRSVRKALDERARHQRNV